MGNLLTWISHEKYPKKSTLSAGQRAEHDTLTRSPAGARARFLPSMDVCGDFHGSLMRFHGFRWILMGLNGIFTDFWWILVGCEWSFTWSLKGFFHGGDP